jgi:hypothetical protein
VAALVPPGSTYVADAVPPATAPEATGEPTVAAPFFTVNVTVPPATVQQPEKLAIFAVRVTFWLASL